MTRIELVDDFRLTAARHEQLRTLLGRCFPGEDYFDTRSYYKQIPPRRLFLWSDDLLIGHLAIEHRAVRLVDGPAQIFGVVDVSVAPEHRGQGHAAQLLAHVETLGRAHGIEFVVLFASNPRLYIGNGYLHPKCELTWLKIHEHRTLGLAEEFVDELMVKPLGDRIWPDGPVDLLGHMF